jgi:putative transcriptional regulator
MTKSAFEKFAAGLEDAIAYVEGERDGFVTHIPEEVDLKGIRKGLGLSQDKFAYTFGFSPGRIKDWEQRRFAIDASSRVLLTVIAKEPAAVLRALGREGDYQVKLQAKPAHTGIVTARKPVATRVTARHPEAKAAG